jgi:hypothetical protein
MGLDSLVEQDGEVVAHGHFPCMAPCGRSWGQAAGITAFRVYSPSPRNSREIGQAGKGALLWN